MLSNSYTLVTVTYRDEIGFLRMQARSLNLYLPRSMISKIIVIANEPPSMPENWRTAVCRAYGDLADRVHILTSAELTTAPWQTGWWSQQMLKVLVSRIITTNFYIALDAKNHLVFPITDRHLEANGKPKMFMPSYVSHPLRRYIYSTLPYFGLQPNDHVERFINTTTPFVIPSQLARDLITYVEKKEQRSFETAFLHGSVKMTEFFMLGAYLRSMREFTDVYDTSGSNYPIIWERMAADDQSIQVTIARSERHRLPFFSVHRRALPLLSDKSKCLLAEFWTRRALFPTRVLARQYLRNPNA